jgi:uncharacterized protein DUF4157
MAQNSGSGSGRRLRILKFPEIPFPEAADLRAAAQAIGLATEGAAGLTVGHGIFVREGFSNDPRLVAHELAHVAQYERHGGILEFLDRYLAEVSEFGYREAPMERQAAVFVASVFADC